MRVPERTEVSADAQVLRLRLRVCALLALTCLLAWALALLHREQGTGGNATWPLVLFGCSLGIAALLSRGGRRILHGAALWLGSAALLVLTDGGAASVMTALIGVLVLAGTTSFAAGVLGSCTQMSRD